MRYFMNKKWIKFEPNKDTFVAFITGFIMIFAFYGWTHFFVNDHGIGYLIYSLLILLLPVLFPIWWMVWHRGYPLSELGLTKNRLFTSILISFVLFLFFGTLILIKYPFYSVIPNLIVATLSLWEAFFVFSWLQLRFDKAFGILPGILLASGFFAAYHLCTVPLTLLIIIFLKDILLSSAFRITSNLLVIWPLAWITANGLGTLLTITFLTGETSWNSGQIALLAIILIIQLLYIFYSSKKA